MSANQNTPSVFPLHPWLGMSKLWVRIHLDFSAPFQKKMFMLVVDEHSKWPETVKITASKTIEELRKLFSAFELPEQVVTNNGPNIFIQNDIKNLKCSPYHPSRMVLSRDLFNHFKSK